MFGGESNILMELQLVDKNVDIYLVILRATSFCGAQFDRKCFNRAMMCIFRIKCSKCWDRRFRCTISDVDGGLPHSELWVYIIIIIKRIIILTKYLFQPNTNKYTLSLSISIYVSISFRLTHENRNGQFENPEIMKCNHKFLATSHVLLTCRTLPISGFPFRKVPNEF